MRGVSPSLYVPVSMLGQVRPSWTARPLADRNHIWLALTARLPTGMSAEQGARVASDFARPLTGTSRTLTLTPGHRGRSERMQALVSPARLFSAAALVLLLIVWANVAGLFLARASGRQRETATRMALGASGRRLAALMLTESFVIAVLGGALGLIFAIGLGRVLGRMLDAPVQVPAIDGRTFVFAWLLILTTTVLVGVVPVLLAAKGEIVGPLKNRAASTSGRRHVSSRQLLVVGQLGLSLVALVAADCAAQRRAAGCRRYGNRRQQRLAGDLRCQRRWIPADQGVTRLLDCRVTQGFCPALAGRIDSFETCLFPTPYGRVRSSSR